MNDQLNDSMNDKLNNLQQSFTEFIAFPSMQNHLNLQQHLFSYQALWYEQNNRKEELLNEITIKFASLGFSAKRPRQ